MVLAPSLLAAWVTWAEIPLSFDASAAQGQDAEDASRKGKAEVVIIVCQTVGTGTPIGSAPFNVTVEGIQSQWWGAAVQVGAECVQAVESVLSAGFRLRDVAVLTIFNTVQYPLIDR